MVLQTYGKLEQLRFVILLRPCVPEPLIHDTNLERDAALVRIFSGNDVSKAEQPEDYDIWERCDATIRYYEERKEQMLRQVWMKFIRTWNGAMAYSERIDGSGESMSVIQELKLGLKEFEDGSFAVAGLPREL